MHYRDLNRTLLKHIGKQKCSDSFAISTQYVYDLLPGVGFQSSSEMSASALEDKEALFDRQASVSDVSRPFLQALAEGRCQDNAVKTFLYMADKYSKQHHITLPIDFPPDHPVEEVGR